jgi:hypothetical protein
MMPLVPDGTRVVWALQSKVSVSNPWKYEIPAAIAIAPNIITDNAKAAVVRPNLEVDQSFLVFKIMKLLV